MSLVGTLDMLHQDGRFVNRFCRAYVSLAAAPPNRDGLRIVSFARFGAVEVRLMEFTDRLVPDDMDVWIELYHHETKSSLDSFRCQDLDEAESLVEHFVSAARRLNESQDD